MPHPVHTGPAPPALVAGHHGDLPARRGHVCLGRAAFGDGAPLRGHRPGVSTVGMAGGLRRRWVTLAGVGWRDLYSICTGSRENGMGLEKI